MAGESACSTAAAFGELAQKYSVSCTQQKGLPYYRMRRMDELQALLGEHHQLQQANEVMRVSMGEEGGGGCLQSLTQQLNVARSTNVDLVASNASLTEQLEKTKSALVVTKNDRAQLELDKQSYWDTVRVRIHRSAYSLTAAPRRAADGRR